jgi:Tol biopolymer transport system component
MNKLRWQVGFLALILGPFTASAQTITAEALFREALMKERAEGDLREAIFRYERIIADFSGDKQVAAEAMYQLSQIYGKQRNPRAEAMLVRLSRTGVAPYAARAQAMLQQQTSMPAGPFPELTLPLDYDRGSPDGRFVVYHKDLWKSGVLYVKELATGVERVLVDGGYVMWPAWSPDSTRLAYTFWSEDDKIKEIRIVRISNGETQKLGVHGWPTSWTDTGEIFFQLPNYGAGGSDYSLLPATGRTPRKIYTGSFGATITPDGTRLIALKSDKLFVINLATGQSQALTTFAGSEGGSMISPDGRLVAFSANPEGRWAFYVAPLDRGLPVNKPVKVSDINVGDAPARGRPWRNWWTRDGIITFPQGRSEANIYRLDIDPKSGRSMNTPVRLTQDAAVNVSPSISPDGKRIAYWYRHRGKSGLAVMDSSGVGERPLHEQAANVQPLYWRSTLQIMFLNTNPGGGKKQTVYSLDVNTGALAPVVESQGLYWHYVPSRNEILQVVGATVKTLSLEDGKSRDIATVDNINAMMALSPDGKRIAYATGRRGQGADKYICEMSLMSIDGDPLGNLLPLQDDYITPNAWSPDGVHLLYSGKDGPRVMAVATRESWPVHSETSDSSWEGGSWSPDGTFVLLVKQTQTENRLAWQGITYEAVMRLLAAK